MPKKPKSPSSPFLPGDRVSWQSVGEKNGRLVPRTFVGTIKTCSGHLATCLSGKFEYNVLTDRIRKLHVKTAAPTVAEVRAGGPARLRFSPKCNCDVVVHCGRTALFILPDVIHPEAIERVFKLAPEGSINHPGLVKSWKVWGVIGTPLTAGIFKTQPRPPASFSILL